MRLLLIIIFIIYQTLCSSDFHTGNSSDKFKSLKQLLLLWKISIFLLTHLGGPEDEKFST